MQKAKWFSATAMILWSTYSAGASDVMVAVEGNQIQAGGIASVTVLLVNTEKSGVIEAPGMIEALFIHEGIEYAATLQKGSSNTPIAAGDWGKVTYQMVVPALLPAGVTRLDLFKPLEASILLTVQPAKQAADHEKTIKEQVVEAVTEEKETFGSLGGLSTYHPIYFLGGISPTDAKFQISLKYQLFNQKGRWARENPWLRGLHLGYTQVSFWDLASESRPFEDTNFQPEIFYSLEGLRLNFLPKDSSLDLQVGLLHESNGREGDDSRSLNILYQRASYRHSLGGDWFARLTGDIWTYVGSLSDNPDLVDYRGHSSMQLTVGSDKSVQLSAYRRGKFGSEKDSYLFDLTVPLKWEGIAKNLNFSLHGQLFTGYGENLLTYDQKETRFRFGLGIHR